MALRLTIVEDGAPASQYVRTFLQERIVIGRARSSDVCLPDMSVSTRHAEIRVSGRDHVLVDLESLNGSSVNDKPVLPFQQRKLASGDTIRIARFAIRVELGAGPGKEEPRDESIRHAKEILARIAERAGSADGAATLVAVAGPCRGTRFILPEGNFKAVIGRNAEAGIVLDDRDISRSHAELAVEDGRFFVRDLGSKNGLTIGDGRVDFAELHFGDAFTIGKSTLALEHPSESALSTIFEAPEEETSSYEAVLRPTSSDTAKSANTRQGHEERPSEPAAPNVSSLPVGPSDPLVGEVEPPPTKRTVEGALSTQAKPEKGSDVGLILIGIILLVAATLGLIYLFR